MNHFCILQILGQILQISPMFLLGNVIFTWTSSNYSSYDVLLIRDTTADPWARVYDTQFTVRDVLLYDSITINMRIPGSSVDNRMTYNGTFYIFISIYYSGYYNDKHCVYIFFLCWKSNNIHRCSLFFIHMIKRHANHQCRFIW